MQDLRRTRLFLLIAAVALAPTSPRSASALVTLGQTFQPGEGCSGQAAYVQTGSSGNTYVAPGDGVITSWRHRAGSEPGPMRFLVLRQFVGTNYFSLVGQSTLTPQEAFVLNEFPIRIPVQGGDAIGLWLRDSTYCFGFTGSEADLSYATLDDPGSKTLFGPDKGWRLDVAATFEPDADRDGFGDETEDRCPTDPSTQGICPPRPTDTDPPETTITKRAPNRTDKATVKFEFRTDEVGSTFECKIDRKPWMLCSSPKKVKRLADGKHRFKVRAKDAAGNVDLSPAKDKFKVIG
jgi:hypothetical protein